LKLCFLVGCCALFRFYLVIPPHREILSGIKSLVTKPIVAVVILRRGSDPELKFGVRLAWTLADVGPSALLLTAAADTVLTQTANLGP
jgi:hypothetical protein